jgi:Fe-S cluster assembly ATP-binding protein
MLTIKQLQVETTEHKKQILKGLDLTLEPGKIHAIMGPNGAGKSTLLNSLAGTPNYTTTAGTVTLKDAEGNHQNILKLAPEERAKSGIFLGFQYPTAIPGVSNLYFLKTALNHLRAHRNEPPMDAFDFMNKAKEAANMLQLDESFLKRNVNEGLSGGEKKYNEILQMMLLEPRCILLDEIDSGLDIDALKIIAKGINHMRDENRTFLLVTHYQRLLNYVRPDYVHILKDGRIIESGDYSLAERLEAEGYRFLEHNEANA